MWFCEKRAKKGLKSAKKGKTFEYLGKNVHNMKKFENVGRLCVIIAHSKLLKKAVLAAGKIIAKTNYQKIQNLLKTVYVAEVGW